MAVVYYVDRCQNQTRLTVRATAEGELIYSASGKVPLGLSYAGLDRDFLPNFWTSQDDLLAALSRSRHTMAGIEWGPGAQPTPPKPTTFQAALLGLGNQLRLIPEADRQGMVEEAIAYLNSL